MQKFEECVAKIDEAPLTGSQKMWIFDKVLMSKISWDFLIHDMTISFVKDLAATQTRMYTNGLITPGLEMSRCFIDPRKTSDGV